MNAHTESAYAKVNLALSVGNARADGYHELVSIFHEVSLHDDLAFTLIDYDAHGSTHPEAGRFIEQGYVSYTELHVTGRQVDEVPLGPSNLICAAIEHISRVAGVALNLRCEVHKRIPTQGGMAGGSADGAAAVRAAASYAASLGGQVLSEQQLLDICLKLGSDVPFMLRGGTQCGRGRGEVLSPIDCALPLHFVILPREGGLSTPAVFRALDAMRDEGLCPGPSPVDVEAFSRVLSAEGIGGATGADAVAGLMVNDLQAPAVALAPDLAEALERGVAAGAVKGMVSGSGPTLFFLCADAQAANDLVEALGGIAVSSRH